MSCRGRSLTEPSFLQAYPGLRRRHPLGVSSIKPTTRLFRPNDNVSMIFPFRVTGSRQTLRPVIILDSAVEPQRTQRAQSEKPARGMFTFEVNFCPFAHLTPGLCLCALCVLFG